MQHIIDNRLRQSCHWFVGHMRIFFTFCRIFAQMFRYFLIFIWSVHLSEQIHLFFLSECFIIPSTSFWLPPKHWSWLQMRIWKEQKLRHSVAAPSSTRSTIIVNEQSVLAQYIFCQVRAVRIPLLLHQADSLQHHKYRDAHQTQECNWHLYWCQN